jgi:opacity protein-like surface antigen
MKKYLLSTLAVAGLMTIATGAFAADASTVRGPYIVGEAGYSFGMKDNEDAGTFALGMGYHMNHYLRSDITIGWRPWGKVNFKDPDGKKADMWSLPIMANVYAQYPIHQMFDVYAMAGLGMSFNKTDSITNASGKTRSNFAWTVGAGVAYDINDCWSLDLGYRYTDLGTARVKGNDAFAGKSKQDVRSNDIKLSARYYF